MQIASRPSAVIFLDIPTAFLEPLLVDKDKILICNPDLDDVNILPQAEELYDLYFDPEVALNQVKTRYFNDSSLARFHQLVKDVDQFARVILVSTSTWSKAASNSEEFRDMLQESSLGNYIFDAVHYGDGCEKSEGLLIQKWLLKHAENLNVKSFVVIGRFCPTREVEARFQDNCVSLPFFDPLSESDANQAYKILKKKDFSLIQLIKSGRMLENNCILC